MDGIVIAKLVYRPRVPIRYRLYSIKYNSYTDLRRTELTALVKQGLNYYCTNSSYVVGRRDWNFKPCVYSEDVVTENNITLLYKTDNTYKIMNGQGVIRSITQELFEQLDFINLNNVGLKNLPNNKLAVTVFKINNSDIDNIDTEVIVVPGHIDELDRPKKPKTKQTENKQDTEESSDIPKEPEEVGTGDNEEIGEIEKSQSETQLESHHIPVEPGGITEELSEISEESYQTPEESHQVSEDAKQDTDSSEEEQEENNLDTDTPEELQDSNDSGTEKTEEIQSDPNLDTEKPQVVQDNNDLNTDSPEELQIENDTNTEEIQLNTEEIQEENEPDTYDSGEIQEDNNCNTKEIQEESESDADSSEELQPEKDQNADSSEEMHLDIGLNTDNHEELQSNDDLNTNESEEVQEENNSDTDSSEELQSEDSSNTEETEEVQKEIENDTDSSEEPQIDDNSDTDKSEEVQDELEDIQIEPEELQATNDSDTQETLDIQNESNLGNIGLYDIYKYMLYNADKNDRFHIPKTIYSKFERKILKILDSDIDMNCNISLSVIYKEQRKSDIKLLVSDDIREESVTVQIIGTEDLVVVERNYKEWLTRSKYIGRNR